MTAACPSCGTPVQGTDGQAVCPACLTEFAVGKPAVHAHWDVLLVDGTRTEGVERFALREQVYTQRLPISARVRPAGTDEWMGIHEVPELMRIYALLGVEAPLQQGVRRLAGWRSSNSPAPTRPVPPTPQRRPPAPVVSEGADVRVVAGQEPEEMELEPEELLPEAPPEPVPLVPPPAPSRSFPWLLLVIPFALLALAAGVALLVFS